MCRRIIIDCEWDDETAEQDAGQLFEGPEYMFLTGPADMALMSMLEAYFNGNIEYTIEEM